MRTLVPTPTAMFTGKDYRDVVSDPTKNLQKVLQMNSFTRIKTALSVPGIHYRTRDPDHELQTLLMRVCCLDMAPRYRRDLAKILLEKADVDLNAKDREGRTALAHACIMGDTTMVKFLAGQSDVDPNLADREGDTPLMHACRGGQIDVVIALLVNFMRLGLQVDEPNLQGMTPLIEAAKSGHADICRRLVTVGKADVNAREISSFNTAQDYAIASRRLSTPDILLLSPIAQRKLQARKKREAMGRSSLSELMMRDSYYPTSGWHQHEQSANACVVEHVDGGKVKQQKQQQQQRQQQCHPRPAKLQQEHLQQLNSAVFQMAKYGLSRVAEQRTEEEEQSVDADGDEKRMISLSLPDLREEDLESKSSSSRGSSPYRIPNPDSHHLRVNHRLSPATSPTPSRKTSAANHPKSSPSKQPPVQPPRLKLPPVDSPNHSPTPPRRRSSIPNKAFSGSRPIVRSSSTSSHQMNAGLSKSPPNNWSPSSGISHVHHHGTVPVVHVIAANKTAEPRKRLSWEGKPSSSVPSYLFR